MTIIHNKIEDNSCSSVDTGSSISTATTAINSATTAVAATVNTISAATIAGTTWATLSGTVGSRVTSLENNGYNQIIRLDSKQTDEQAFRLPWGKVASVSHEELIKYIGERDLRESNELVRTLWDRYQTAVKLIWSEDDEQEK